MKIRPSVVLVLSLFGLPSVPVAGPPGPGGGAQGEKVLNLPMRSAGPGSLDPVTGSTVYDNRASSMAYETLLQFKYLQRPVALEPLLLETMPSSEDQKIWRFKLRQGVRFTDDPCFEGGIGRELVAADVLYSLKRLADKRYGYENYWMLEGTIVGLDAYREAQAARVAAGEPHDYGADVPGMRLVDDYSFEVELVKPVPRFMWVLAMFQTSVVPREAVEHYGDDFGNKAVGTGPFILEEWKVNESLTWVRNPSYRDELFPAEWTEKDAESGLNHGAGKKLPFADRVNLTMFVDEEQMWQDFKAGKLDYTQVPDENFLEAFHKGSHKLKREFARQGVIGQGVPLLGFLFVAFNMEDPVLGGYGEKQRKLRQAFHLAMDLEEFNDIFFNNTSIVYDGMIPPGLDGYPPDGQGPITWNTPDLERAKQLLAEAGYPGGAGLPVIDYCVPRRRNMPEQADLAKRQLAKLGVKLNVRVLNFSELIDTVNGKQAPMFSFTWSSDYPDAENNLALFYGPYAAPGTNHSSYANEEFDELYRTILTMSPSPERTAIYDRMRDMVLQDAPYIGSMAETRFYAIQPWMKNFKPTEVFFNWAKYLDVDESLRRP